jgi:MoaA/NifB/PqqE/SkfB family radical SAM enzyme
MHAAGAQTINIVGAGEPTVDPHFRDVIEHIHGIALTTVLFTNGIALAEDPDLVEYLYRRNVTVVVKLNSMRADVQDLVGGRPGYTAKRDRAIDLLIDRSFTANMPTRLGIDTIVFRGNLQELPDIHSWARMYNVFPIAADYIPTGRTEDGQFHGFAALTHLTIEDQKRVAELLAPISSQEREALAAKLGIRWGSGYAYYGGGACTQILGLYVDIEGNIWPCVARRTLRNGVASTKPLGNIRSGDLPSSVWRKAPYINEVRTAFDGACPYKGSFAANAVHSLIGIGGLLNK